MQAELLGNVIATQQSMKQRLYPAYYLVFFWVFGAILPTLTSFALVLGFSVIAKLRSKC